MNTHTTQRLPKPLASAWAVFADPADCRQGVGEIASHRFNLRAASSMAASLNCFDNANKARVMRLRTAAAAQSESFIERILSVRRLRAAPGLNTAKAAASVFCGGEVQVQPEGAVLRFKHALSFVPVRSVLESVFPSHFSIGRYQRPALARPSHSFFNSSEAALEQKKLQLYGRLDGPSVAPNQLVRQCKTYREAVRTCWAYKRIARMTIRQLAAEGGFHPQHVGDWLNPDDKVTRKSLPGGAIETFEALMGNSIISQWVAWRARLTSLEEIQATQAVAA